MKKIYSFLILLVLSLSVKSQVDFTIGTATGANTGSTYPCPIQDFYEGSRSQFLYLASELQAAGMGAGFINSIKFNATSVTAPTGPNFPGIEQYCISIGSTATTSLDNTIWETGTQTVWGPQDYTVVVGVNEFIFTTPFFWNGTDNIVIDVCTGDPANGGYTAWTNNAIFPWTDNLGFNASHTFRQDNLGNFCGHVDALDNSGFPPNYTTRPDAIFNWTSPTPCTGAPVAGAAISTKDTVCSGIPFNVYTTGSTLGGGLKYQWDSSLNGVNFYPIAGDTNFTHQAKAGISVTTWYRRNITCSGSTTTSTPTKVFVRPFYECYCGPLVNTSLHTTSTSPTIESVGIGAPVNYLNNNINIGSSGAPTMGYSFYTDTTGTTNPPIPQLRQATAYTMTIGTSAAPVTNAVGFWVDWNHNGLYDSAEYTNIPFVTNSTTADVTIDVPATAPLGLTMMRIRTSASAIVYSNGCTNFTNGETEDYIFRVLPGIPCSGTPLGGFAISSVPAICPNVPFTLSDSLGTEGVTNLTYQWQDSSSLHGWQDIPGATGRNYICPGINVATYYRRKITCGGSTSTSVKVGVAMNLIIYCYCSPLNGTSLHAATSPTIEQVDLSGGAVTYTNASPGANPAPSLGYSLFDDTSAAPHLAQAITYTLNVTASAQPNQAAVWIDWDHNGILDTYEYQLITFTGTAGTVDITPPINAVLGFTIMRVRIRGGTFTTNACEQYFSGETEDYVIKVVPGTACTGTPLGGDAVCSVTSICPNIPFNLKVDNATDGLINITYQWQDSTATHGWQDIGPANTKNYTIPGIAEATCYRRKITCTSTSAISTYSTTVCVTLNPIFECYCSPLNGTTLHSSAGSPTINQIDLVGCTVAYTDQPVLGVAPSLGYTPMTDTSLAPNLSIGVSYSLTVSTTTNPAQAAVWVDWDHSGTFDPSEYQVITFTGASAPFTGVINIAPTASNLLGFTMMRIRVRAANFTTACEPFGSGQTVDYVIKVVAGSPCTGTPIGGAAATLVTTACAGTSFNVNVTGTVDCYTGLTYQWQDSTAAHGWQAMVPAQNGLTLNNITQSVATSYRRKITCNISSASSLSASVFVGQLLATYATLPFAEDFENTWDDGCGDAGSHTIPNNSWRNSPLMSDTSWRRDDEGGLANWTLPNSGLYNPAASTGTHSARFHSYEAPSGKSGNLDLYLNCGGISPQKTLTFDYINTDGTDAMKVLLSTDGGITFTNLSTYGVAAAWATKTINFNSTSPTTVIRFSATGDFGISDIGIDNVAVISIINVDLAATAVTAPTGNLQATAAGTITVSVTNAGVAPIDFTTNPGTVNVILKDPLGNNVIVAPKALSGTLAVGASIPVNVTTSANLTAVGTYSIKAFVSVTGDGSNANDTTGWSSFTTTGIPVYAVANGNWGDGATWSTGTVPVATDTVTIAGYTVTLGGSAPSPYNCASLGMGNGGSLLVPASTTLNTGLTNVNNKSITFGANATLNISGGTLNHKGFIVFNDSANFIMSAGNLNIDGNNGTDAGSVPSGVDILGIGTVAKAYSFGNINLTGGTIKIVDPHRFNGNAFAYRATVAKTIGTGNTLVLGDPTSTNTSNTGNGGFLINTSAGTSKLYLGSLKIDGGNTVGNRFTTSGNVLGVSGDLTINANAELRATLPSYFAGNITNNGVFASGGVFNLQSYTNGVAGAVTNTQNISGTGVFRNNIATATISAPGSGYAVGDVLTLSGGTSAQAASLYVISVGATGNITAVSILNMGNYTVAPTGTLSVTGGSGTGATFTSNNLVTLAQFANLIVNNNSTGGINISSLGTLLPSQTGTVSGTLTLTNGIINNGSNVFTLGTSPSARGTLTYTSGVFTGKFSRWFGAATNTGATGDFPVGKNNYARNARVEFTTAPTAGGTLTAELIASAPGYGGFPVTDGATQVINLANDAFWRIDASGITGGNYTLSLTDSGIVNVLDVSLLVTLKRPSNTSVWTVDGTQGTNTGTLIKPTVVRTGLSGFSEFAIASGIGNPLPVSAVKLAGEKVGNNNQLKWTAINESEIKGYDLERSADGSNFSAIAFVLSKENGTVSPRLDYSFTDNNSITTDGYYRLKQIAKDGNTLYSNIVLIKGSKVTGIVVGNIYPNPVKNLLNVTIAASANKQVVVVITDMNGKQVLNSNYSLTKGDNSLKVNLSNVAVGTYAVSVIDANGAKSNVVTFVKEK